MAFTGIRNLGSLTKLGNVLSSSVSETLGLGSSLGLPIAIEFGAGSLKILQISAGDPPALVAAASLETPEDLLDDANKRLRFQLEGLPRLLRHGGFKGRRAVCAIPTAGIMCKHVSLGRVDGMSLASQVADALPSTFGMDSSMLVHRYSEVPGAEKGNKTDVIITGVARDVVARLMSAINGCKLRPVGMHSGFASVLRTFDHIHKRDSDAAINTIYLDLGSNTTSVMISHGRELAFGRVINKGGHHLDAMICKQLKCELSEARALRMAGDSVFKPAPRAVVGVPAAAALVTPDGHDNTPRADERGLQPMTAGFTPDITTQPRMAIAPPSADVSEVIEAITDEVLMCLRYHETQFPARKVERAIFVGGEARHRGLCQAIARALKLPAQMADPLARIARTGSEPAVGVDLKQPQPGWAVALGLCLSPTDL